VPIESSKSRNISELKRRTARPHAKCEAAPFNIASLKNAARLFPSCCSFLKIRSQARPPCRPHLFLCSFPPFIPTCRRLAAAVVVASGLACEKGREQRSANRPDCALACGSQAVESSGLLPGAKPSAITIPHAAIRTKPQRHIVFKQKKFPCFF
jgi:hypothetical protein